MFGHSLSGVLVDGEESLAGAPVHLADELATEGVDDTSDGGGRTLADEVKVEHALDSSGLHATVTVSYLGGIELRDPNKTYYTKHLVLLWKRVWERGERTRLGGWKRVMLSLADFRPLAVVARGVDSGMMLLLSVRVSMAIVKGLVSCRRTATFSDETRDHSKRNTYLEVN